MSVLYAGGPVDYGHRDRTHGWRHMLAFTVPDWTVYCPICANDDHPDIDVIMRRNEIALLQADKAVFLLDGLFTVGTPVEIAMRVTHRPPKTVCIVHTAGDPGAFVRVWQRMGVVVLPTFDGVPTWLQQPI